MLCYTFEGVGHDRGTIFVFKGAMFLLFLKRNEKTSIFRFVLFIRSSVHLNILGFFSFVPLLVNEIFLPRIRPPARQGLVSHLETEQNQQRRYEEISSDEKCKQVGNEGRRGQN